MKVAIVHDWLVEHGGAENVLKCLLQAYPSADLYSLVDFYPDDQRDAHLFGKRASTSFIQKLPFANKIYRNYIPFMPLAVEQIDLSRYDLVISSSYAVAKGVLTGPNQLHICYCHSPMRYAWDLQFQYLKEASLDKGLLSPLVRIMLHQLRNWDYRTANGVDFFIANSRFIRKRIFKVYRRESDVIHPPVNLSRFKLCLDKSDYFVTASRMVPYKKIDLIVRSFTQMPDRKLVVIGDGPDMKKVKAVAAGFDNIVLKGYCSDAELENTIAKAKAFVFAAEEDFGIVPLEAQASGTPVIAFGKGGALETVLDGETGLFFGQQSCESIVDAVARFDSMSLLHAKEISEHANNFGEDSFIDSIRAYVESKLGN